MLLPKFLFALLLPIAIATTASAAQPAISKPAQKSAATTPSKASANGIDAGAKARLVGEHMLTVQWLSWSGLRDAGNLVVRDLSTVLSAEGEQLGRGEYAGDYLKMSGKIVSASKDGFVFEGDILLRVHHNANGEECKRSGTFTFKTKSGRKYWRMQEMDSPCDTATDYVDVYFRGI
jgi:hypothetical protein